MTFTLILASGSAYRKAQLAQLVGDGFACQTPNINENALEGESAEDLALRLSFAKAQAVAQNLKENAIAHTHESYLIIAGDQTAACEQHILGKPGNVKSAHSQLAFCSNKEVIFNSGLCVLRPQDGWHRLRNIKTTVKFRNLSETEITAYVAKENVLDCAGSFKCEGLGISLFTSISSDDPSALIGLPLISLNALLIEAGFNPLLESAN